MGQIRAFVAKLMIRSVWVFFGFRLSHLRVLLGLFCPDFYSDIEDFTQILSRYLPKKMAAKTSVLASS